MLRQNPHNVHEWHKRVKLFDGQPERQIKVFAEAVATVDPDKVGPPPTSCCDKPLLDTLAANMASCLLVSTNTE